jgi:ribonuclease D
MQNEAHYNTEQQTDRDDLTGMEGGPEPDEEDREEIDHCLGVTYVTDEEKLQALILQLGGQKRVALDTEADSLHHYYEKVCLIQLNIDDTLYLIDPLVGLDLSAFFSALRDRQLILHGADYDLRLLRKNYDFVPCEIIDTMIAAQLLGYEKLGLADLVEQHRGVKLSKSAQKMNWSKRPLSAKMISYAGNDVRYLPSVADEMCDALRRLGRLEWLEESCYHQIVVTEEQHDSDPEKEWRIKGTFGLERRVMAFVKAIWYWREDEAKNADIPCFKIVTNETVIDLARWLTEHGHDAVREYPHLPRSIRGPRLTRLIEVIQEAKRLQPGQWPRPLKSKGGPRYSLDNILVANLKKRRDETALGLRISQPVLAPTKALTRLALHRPRNNEEMLRDAGLLRWQVKVLGEAFLEEIALRDSKQKKATN